MKYAKNWRRLQLALAVGLFAALACSSVLPQSANPETAVEGEDGADVLDCERLNYPCSLAETEPAALSRSGEVMDLAEQVYLEEGSMLAAGQRLAEANDVVELAYDERGLWFRVEGAPPMWLWDYDEAAGVEPTQASTSHRGSPLARPAAQDSGPVGDQDPGQEPKKRALFLLPWAYHMGDDSTALASILSEHRNYQCSGCLVRQVTQQDPRQSEPDQDGYYGPGLGRFMNWGEFDLLYIFSHGRQWCGLPDEESGGYFLEGQPRPIDECAGMLTTGRFRDSIFDNASTLDTPGVAWGHKPGDDWWIEALSPDFFRDHYQGGLDDALLFFNTCQLLNNDSFSSTLLGQDSAVVGWTQSVKIERGIASASEFFTALVEDGLRVEKALAKVKESDGYNIEETYAGAELDLDGNPNARAVEIITWLHPIFEQELDQVGSLPVEGVPMDGQPDQLLARFRVDGIDEDQDPGSFEIQLKVGDQELSQTLTPQDKVGDYSYEVRDLIDLDFDVNGQDELPLEAWIDLPTGGQTRHYLEDEDLASCGWTGRLSGAQSGEIKGDIALNLAEFGDVDQAQLQALVDSGQLESLPSIPDTGALGDVPDMIFLTGENPYPAVMASGAGGAFLLQGQNDMAFPTTQDNAISFSSRSDVRFEGSINATLVDPINQANITVAADFIWNAGSFCDINLILEAAKLNLESGD